ncbi:MAG: hypothetical protein MHM6MM_002260 [Cercozoa sp. M6MM]
MIAAQELLHAVLHARRSFSKEDHEKDDESNELLLRKLEEQLDIDTMSARVGNEQFWQKWPKKQKFLLAMVLRFVVVLRMQTNADMETTLAVGTVAVAAAAASDTAEHVRALYNQAQIRLATLYQQLDTEGVDAVLHSSSLSQLLESDVEHFREMPTRCLSDEQLQLLSAAQDALDRARRLALRVKDKQLSLLLDEQVRHCETEARRRVRRKRQELAEVGNVDALLCQDDLTADALIEMCVVHEDGARNELVSRVAVGELQVHIDFLCDYHSALVSTDAAVQQLFPRPTEKSLGITSLALSHEAVLQLLLKRLVALVYSHTPGQVTHDAVRTYTSLYNRLRMLMENAPPSSLPDYVKQIRQAQVQTLLWQLHAACADFRDTARRLLAQWDRLLTVLPATCHRLLHQSRDEIKTCAKLLMKHVTIPCAQWLQRITAAVSGQTGPDDASRRLYHVLEEAMHSLRHRALLPRCLLRHLRDAVTKHLLKRTAWQQMSSLARARALFMEAQWLAVAGLHLAACRRLRRVDELLQQLPAQWRLQATARTMLAYFTLQQSPEPRVLSFVRQLLRLTREQATSHSHGDDDDDDESDADVIAALDEALATTLAASGDTGDSDPPLRCVDYGTLYLWQWSEHIDDIEDQGVGAPPMELSSSTSCCSSSNSGSNHSGSTRRSVDIVDESADDRDWNSLVSDICPDFSRFYSQISPESQPQTHTAASSDSESESDSDSDDGFVRRSAVSARKTAVAVPVVQREESAHETLNRSGRTYGMDLEVDGEFDDDDSAEPGLDENETPEEADGEATMLRSLLQEEVLPDFVTLDVDHGGNSNSSRSNDTLQNYREDDRFDSDPDTRVRELTRLVRHALEQRGGRYSDTHMHEQLWQLANALHERGDTTRALHFRRVLCQRTAYRFQLLQQRLQRLRHTSRVNTSVPALVKAERQLELTKQRLLDAHIELGNAALDAGQVAQADAAFRKAEQIVVRFRGDLTRGKVASNRFNIEMSMGRVSLCRADLAREELSRRRYLRHARNYFARALALAQTLPTSLRADCHVNLGLVYRSMGSVEDALQHMARAVALAEKANRVNRSAFSHQSVVRALQLQISLLLDLHRVSLREHKRQVERQALRASTRLLELLQMPDGEVDASLRCDSLLSAAQTRLLVRKRDMRVPSALPLLRAVQNQPLLRCHADAVLLRRLLRLAARQDGVTLPDAGDDDDGADDDVDMLLEEFDLLEGDTVFRTRRPQDAHAASRRLLSAEQSKRLSRHDRLLQETGYLTSHQRRRHRYEEPPSKRRRVAAAQPSIVSASELRPLEMWAPGICNNKHVQVKAAVLRDLRDASCFLVKHMIRKNNKYQVRYSAHATAKIYTPMHVQLPSVRQIREWPSHAPGKSRLLSDGRIAIDNVVLHSYDDAPDLAQRQITD